MSSRPAHKRGTVPDHTGRVRRITLGVLYLTALSLLVVWEYRDRLEVLSSDCELREQVKSSFYNRPYERFLDWGSSGAAGHVAALAIPLNLEEVQKNLCLGREYMADVLGALAPHNPSVVVIDKFYSAGTCASEPDSTQDLAQAIGALKIPVIIGESTDGLEDQVASSCLVRKSQLDFGVPNVRHGLTRINTEPERLPLRWLVLSGAPDEATPASAADAPKAEFGDSLSFAAVKAYDPAFAAQGKIQQMLLRDDHAYANVTMEIPRITTTQLLCSTSDERIRKKWSLPCASMPTLPNLMGKVVVIGSETTADQKVVLGRRVWGFELQARYIEALLSGDDLGYLPIWCGLVVFALYIFLIEGLPTILIARRPRWKRMPFIRHAYPHQRYLWVVICAGATIVVSAFVALALRYLPPLLVYGDILFLVITRLIIFSIQSAEDPFLHAHHHRKAHPMSTPNSHDHHKDASGTSTPTEQPAVDTFVPDQPPEPAPAPPPPTSRNRPASEAASEG